MLLACPCTGNPRCLVTTFPCFTCKRQLHRTPFVLSPHFQLAWLTLRVQSEMWNEKNQVFQALVRSGHSLDYFCCCNKLIWLLRLYRNGAMTACQSTVTSTTGLSKRIYGQNIVWWLSILSKGKIVWQLSRSEAKMGNMRNPLQTELHLRGPWPTSAIGPS